MAQLFSPGARRTADHPTPPVRPASTGETVAVLVASAWLTAGLFLDGYAHEHLLTGDESFFTPWHAVFYSGYVATVLSVGRLAWRRLGSGPRLRDCLPAPYRPSVLGAAVFACGGIGDALWHTRFGFERGTEALYSPTHLVLLVGLVLIVTGPFRAAVHSASPVIIGRHEFALPLVSLTLAASIVAFFAPWSLNEPDWYRVAYDGRTGAGEEAVNAALGAELATCIILVGAMLLILRRWRPPHGAFTSLFGATVALFNGAFSGSLLGVLAALVGGATADTILVPLRARGDDGLRTRTLVAAGAAPFAMIATWHVLLYCDDSLQWPAPLAAGTPVLCALSGLALAMLALQPQPAVAQPR